MPQHVVLDVGNCAPDFSAIKSMLTSNFDCEVMQAHGAEDALRIVRDNQIALVLINRKLDRDYSDGTDVLKQLKADESTAYAPVMLVTNYEEHQKAAVELGAIEGFGKLALSDPATHAKLSAVLA
jgi:CheY-like chemotaxis protein